jgi:F0F1-type ATP synthase assembly protein I
MSKDDDFIRKSLNEFQRILRTSAPAASASYSLIGSLIIFSLAGYFLDSYLLSFPLFLVLGLLLGIVVGFYGLYKFISK